MKGTVGSDLLKEVWQALDTVQDPCSVFNQTDLSLVELGMIYEVVADEKGSVHIDLLLDDPTCIFFFEIKRLVDAAVTAVPGVSALSVDINSEELWTEDRLSEAGRGKLTESRQRRRHALARGITVGWPLPFVVTSPRPPRADAPVTERP